MRLELNEMKGDEQKVKKKNIRNRIFCALRLCRDRDSTHHTVALRHMSWAESHKEFERISSSKSLHRASMPIMSDREIKSITELERTSSKISRRFSVPTTDRDKVCITDQKLEDESNCLSLSWTNSYPIIPDKSEIALLSTLIPWGKTERGMMRDHTPLRLKKIIESCSIYGIKLEQALSLRRYHIKFLNHEINMNQLGLGNDHHIRGTEKLFISTVLKYFEKCDIPCITKEEQKLKFIEAEMPGEDMAQTPDVILKEAVNLTTDQPSNADSTFAEYGQINWIEAKMCYGASMKPCETDTLVSSLLLEAKKNVIIYGPGAFVFAYGCGSSLRDELRDMGVSVLDSGPLDLMEMQNHQKQWCANDHGQILP